MSNQHLQSNEVLRKFAPLPYQSLNSDGFIITTNEAWLDLLGYEFGEVKGEPFRSFLTADSADKFESRFPEFQASGGVSGVEFTMIRADGEEIPVSFDGQIEYAEDGSIKRTHCQFRDISDRDHREQELRRMKRAVDASGHAIYITDPDGSIEYTNSAFEDITGYSESEAIGSNPRILNSGEMSEEYFEDLWRTVQSGEVWEEEVTNRRKSGELYYANQTIAPIKGSDGEVGGYVGIQNDVTQRKGREQEIEQARSRFKNLFERAPEAIAIHDTTGNVLAVNQQEIDNLGYTREELTSMNVDEIEVNFSRNDFQKIWEEMDVGETRKMEGEHKRKDGSTFPVAVWANKIKQNGDAHFLTFARDITDRKERERELRRKNRLFEQAQAVGDVGWWEKKIPSDDITWSQRIHEMWGAKGDVASIDHETFQNFIHPEDEKSVDQQWEAAKTGGLYDTEHRIITGDGEIKWMHEQAKIRFDEEGEPISAIGIAQDITERKRRENRLKKRERMLRELQERTQEFLAADDESTIFSGIEAAVSNVLDTTGCYVMRYDGETGQLKTVGVSSKLPEELNHKLIIEPGGNLLWDVFNSGESQVISDFEPKDFHDSSMETVPTMLAVPIGHFGLIVGLPANSEPIEDAEIELVKLLGANAEAVLMRLEGEERVSEITQELSLQNQQVGKLQTLIESIEGIQQRFAESDTRETLERSACEELASTDLIDFAWMGHPQTSDTHLSPSAWAGQNAGYLDEVSTEDTEAILPSQEAARKRKTVSYEKIASKVSEGKWAGKALSRNFNSVLSIPLLHDDTLYGVLTLYASSESAFTPMYQDMFEKVTSLLADYLGIINIQYADSKSEVLELEFALQDPNYSLDVLANATGTKIVFEAVLESMEESIRILVTVEEGSPEEIIEQAKTMPSIAEAEFFGDPENGQLALTHRKPFLASEVQRHGARLIRSVASPDETHIRLTLADAGSVRPLMESLSNRYSNIELLSRRETLGDDENFVKGAKETLTERQYEMLKAAHFGGYYDKPRGVTGEDLAKSFGLSNSVVHGHLKAGHRKLLEQLFVTGSDNEGANN